VMIEGIIGLTYQCSAEQVSLQLYLDPRDVVFATDDHQQETLH
jgi:hypothetical protein